MIQTNGPVGVFRLPEADSYVIERDEGQYEGPSGARRIVVDWSLFARVG